MITTLADTRTLDRPAAYPVQVDGDLEPDPSRWLWLVKWLLALPHYLVLPLLWAAFAVLSVVALVAILVTGRYPRAIFDFNVGVLRWTWRVAYYSYGALATDRYPPFSLAEDANYPAHLSVHYPNHLSRGLVLVKWWLLALPHYLVVSVFVGGGVWVARDDDRWPGMVGSGPGLVGLLTLIAAIVLAVSGTYPRPLYDALMALNRWVLRVAAYVALMTDQYPPFRFDLGGHDPGSPVVPQDGGPDSLAPAGEPTGAPSSTVQSANAPASAQQPPHGGTGRDRPPVWTAGRVTSVVIGALLVLMSMGLLTASTGVLVGDHTRDGRYLTSHARYVTGPGYAVVVEGVEMHGMDWNGGLPRRAIGDVRVRVRPQDPSSSLFVGIAPAADVDDYLAGVARTVPGRTHGLDRDLSGAAVPQAPRAMGIWSAQTAGAGAQELVWTPAEGNWALVLMNADASPGVTARVDVGVTVSWLDWLGVGLLSAALLLLGLGTLLIVLATRSASRATMAHEGRVSS